MARTSSRPLAYILIALITMPPVSLAYETPLQSESVREAYFLGKRSDEKTTSFLGSYMKHLPVPEQGPYISEVSLYTPYAQVVLNSWRNAMGSSSQQAERDYHSSEDVIRVIVRIEFTPTYTALQDVKPNKDSATKQAYVFRQQDFWRDFQFELHQGNGFINARGTQGAPIYDEGGFSGAEVQLEYDANEVNSEETAFEVITPDGQHVVAKFNLSKLR
jgi:hypothetical protein